MTRRGLRTCLLRYNEECFPQQLAPLRGREIPMPYRLLIAEDSQTTRKQMERLLELEGAYQVDTVGDGKAALEALTSKPYSLPSNVAVSSTPGM